jgi:hypothetical protein
MVAVSAGRCYGPAEAIMWPVVGQLVWAANQQENDRQFNLDNASIKHGHN